MGTPREPRPAKYFVALLSSEIELIRAIETDLEPLLGGVDNRSDTVGWAISRFYESEMGSGLLRRFLSFGRLLSPQELADIKLGTQGIEERYRRAPTGGRRINLDPGYLEAGKVVLASTKNASQRIYLRGGIFAESTLFYHDGMFHACSYTYADYLWPATLRFLAATRARYLEQLRQVGL
jgi:hypothetical protein